MFCHVDDQGWLQPDPGCPFIIIHQALPEASTQLTIRPYSVILHSNAGPRKTSGEDLWRYMNRGDITGECHANVETAADGRGIFRQMMPFTRRADCNAKANSWGVGNERVGAISFETQDEGYPTLPTTPWTPGQRTAIVEALKAIRDRYNIPMTRCQAWNGQGVGAHRDFPEWSIYVGKTCPGDLRVIQMERILEDLNNPPQEKDMLRFVYKPAGYDPGWWPWIGRFQSGALTLLVSGDVEALSDGNTDTVVVADKGQYQRMAVSIGADLTNQFPTS